MPKDGLARARELSEDGAAKTIPHEQVMAEARQQLLESRALQGA